MAAAMYSRHDESLLEKPVQKAVKKKSNLPTPSKKTRRPAPWYVSEYKSPIDNRTFNLRPTSACAPAAKTVKKKQTVIEMKAVWTPIVAQPTATQSDGALSTVTTAENDQQQAASSGNEPSVDGREMPKFDDKPPEDDVETPEFDVAEMVTRDFFQSDLERRKSLSQPEKKKKKRRGSKHSSKKKAEEPTADDTVGTEIDSPLTPWADDYNFTDDISTQAYVYEIWGLNAPSITEYPEETAEDPSASPYDILNPNPKLARMTSSATARSSSPSWASTASSVTSRAKSRSAKTRSTWGIALPSSPAISQKGRVKKKIRRKSKRKSAPSFKKLSVKGRSTIKYRRSSTSKLPRPRTGCTRA